MKKILVVIVFFLVFSLFLSACSGDETVKTDETNWALESDADDETAEMIEIVEVVGNFQKTFDLSGDADYCVVDGYRLWFLPDSELEALREGLVELLSNPTVAYYEGDGLIGYKPVDPDKPYIQGGSTHALFDVTMDGIPELLVIPHGYSGSSGMVRYYAYDIESGREVGALPGGNALSWCMYFNTEEDTLSGVGQFWYRYGWPERDRFISKIGWSEMHGKYTSKAFLNIYHDVNREKIEGEKNSHGGDTYLETTETKFYVNARETDMDTYYYYYDNFVYNNIRISETMLSSLHLRDVCDDDDSYEEKAEKMADALLSTGQKFICKIEIEE